MEFNEDAVLAVKRGAYWLDNNYPDWAQRIQLDELEMDDCATCIVGQAIGDFSETVAEAGNVAMYSLEALNWSVENGFDIPDNVEDYAETQYRYRELETLWTEQVKERLGEG